MDETNMNARQYSGAGRVIANHKAKLAACAAFIAIIGAGAVFAADKPAPNPLMTPVVDLSTSDAPQQAVPSFANLVERVKPAVVSVYVKAEEVDQVSNPFGQGQNPFKGTPFENLPFQFGPQSQNGHPQTHLMQAQGSGFFISPDGYLITNNHVVDHAKSVEIMMSNGKRYKAKVAGTDPKTDLALLKVEGSTDFPYVRLASKSPRIGDWVVAMGNPFGLGGTVTAGIVSANGRDIGSGPYDDFIQIDAPINKGNSGGPTFNQNGEVVGVNTAIFSPSGGSVGIAFDIPAETVKYVSQQLRSSGHVTRGWIGVSIQPVTADIADSLGLKQAKGALVDEPQDGGPASRAGLKSQDVIVSVNDHEIKDGRDLARTIAAVTPGSQIAIAYIRNGEKHNVDLKVGRYPDHKSAQNDNSSDSDFKLGMNSCARRPGRRCWKPRCSRDECRSRRDCR